jgi:DNA mismatch repair protein MutS
MKSTHNHPNHPLEQLEQSGIKLTPMMEQYWNIKKLHTDKVLFFRMGDFYEVFFDDAQVCAKILNITLTHRGKIQEIPIPMAGIPHHAASAYVDKLIQASVKVAICEQVEDPKASKGIVKRAITQICTPVLPYDLDKVDALSDHFLITINPIANETRYWIVAIDFVHGDFKAFLAESIEELNDFISLLKPKECLQSSLLPDLNESTKKLLESLGCMITYIGMNSISSKSIINDLEKLIPNISNDEFLRKQDELIDSLKLISYYLSATQSSLMWDTLRPIHIVKRSNQLELNAKTYFHLEILPGAHQAQLYNQQSNSLLSFMNKCQTASGLRLLKQWFTTPIVCPKEIIKRQMVLKAIINEQFLPLQDIRNHLKPVRDIARILSKLSSGKLSSQDLINLAQTIESYLGLKFKLAELQLPENQSYDVNDQSLNTLAKNITRTINDELRASIENGNLIRSGVSEKRDELANIHQIIEARVQKLEENYKQEFQIPTLRIKSNNINGFFIEISKGQSTKAPAAFQRMQTLTNAERFTSPELSKIEETLVTAKDKLHKLEKEIFESLKENVFQASSDLKSMSDWLALIDVYHSLAFVSRDENFCCPEIIQDKKINIQGAWHPIIKSQLGGNFVPHNINLTDKKGLLLITGPNMAGKTTVMREAAIIQFLAQIGCFVPAHQCSLPIVDKIFCRVGAHDDIHTGQSTFMVEMSETAEILRHATPSSLILFDEIGRGTSTYDGLSIAWSLLEYLSTKLKCFTFFSTHYHELIELAESLPYAQNMTVKTSTEKDQLKFLYEFIEGGAKQSFGIKVALMAGVPKYITQRAESILQQLESHQVLIPEQANIKAKSKTKQYELFPEIAQPKPQEVESEKWMKELKALNLNHLTPMQALKKIESWQNQIQIQ